MPAETRNLARQRLAGACLAIRQMGRSDGVFLFATIAVVAVMGLKVVGVVPVIEPVAFAIRAAYLALTLWYVFVGARRRRLLGYFREALEKTPASFAIYDERDRLIACNSAYKAAHASAFARLRGPVVYDKLIRMSFSDRFSGDELETRVAERLSTHRNADGKAHDQLYPDGRWLRVTKSRTPTGANVGVGTDVTELYDAKAAVEREHARFRGLAETLPIGIWHFDAEGRTIFVNRDLLALFGLKTQADLNGVAAPTFIAAHVEGFDPAQLNDDHNNLGNLSVHTRDGRTRHVIIRTSGLPAETPGFGETIMSFIDVTPLKEAERRIDYLAHRDMLTGARNRAAFVHAIETAAEISTVDNPCWLLAMDLDGFKPINDQYGHAAGDKLLREFVNRIELIGRPDSYLYRLGGDEFCLLLMGTAREHIEAIAQAILDATSHPFQLGHNQVSIAVSIGIAAVPLDTADAEAAQRYADLALYSVKKRPGGGGGYAFFTREHAERDMQERVMTLDLSRAIANDDFEFVFQPIFRREDRSVACIEALLRWTNRRTGEQVPPDRFIATAERSGVICRIDQWVFTRIAEHVTQLLARGIEPPLVMINMSPLTLEESRFLGWIDDVLRAFPNVAGHTCIEITEGVMIDDRARLCETFRRLGERGIRTAIDDFGTGQTSVALLRDIPVSFIKIDRTYVWGIETDPQSMAIVSTIVRLSRELGVEVIGEGVETEEQLAALGTAGCDLIQGYLWARPMAAGDVEDLLLAEREPQRAPRVTRRV